MTPIPLEPVPILIGGGAEPAIRRAARHADGIFSNVPADQFLQQLEWLNDECARIDRDPAELRIVHYSVMLPGDSEQDAYDKYVEHFWQMMWKYSDMEASVARTGPPPAAPPFDESRMERLLTRATVAGTAPQIVDYLGGIREQAGIPVEFVARSYFPTLDYEDQVELMQVLAEGVAPHI